MSLSQYHVDALRRGVSLRCSLFVAVVLVASSFAASAARATVFTWNGGSFFGETLWADSANWGDDQIDIIGYPDGTNDKATVSTSAYAADLGANRTIGDLAISNGGRVDLGGFTLTVNTNAGASRNGETIVGGGASNGSRLIVGSGILDTDTLSIISGGAVDIGSGKVQIDSAGSIASGGQLIGGGNGIEIDIPSGSGGLYNEGSILPDGPFEIQRFGGSGTFEQNGILTVKSGDTTRLDIPTTIGGGTTTLESEATLEFDQTANISGGTQESPLIYVGESATLKLDGPTTWDRAFVNEVRFPGDPPTTGIIRPNGPTTVTNGLTLINARVYDLDGRTTVTTTTIEAGATLGLVVDFIDAFSNGDGNDGYEGTLIIEDTGSFFVRNEAGNWVNQFDGTIRLQGMPVDEPQAVVGGVSITNQTGAIIEGNGTFEAGVTNGIGGIVRPGLSEGTLRFNSGFAQQTGGTLEIELQSTPLDPFDKIIVSNGAALGGTLDVTLQSPVEVLGLEFEIIDVAGTLSGEFDGLGEGALVATNGLPVFITYRGGDGNDVVLFSASGLAGDYNNDGVVNAADYTVWRDNVGNDVTIPNDQTPGMVTEEDYGVWVDNFGSGAGGSSLANAAVPEPASLVLLAGWLVAGVFNRSRRTVGR